MYRTGTDLRPYKERDFVTYEYLHVNNSPYVGTAYDPRPDGMSWKEWFSIVDAHEKYWYDEHGFFKHY